MLTIAAVLLTCATLVAGDGDTIKCNGVNMRDMGDGKPFVSGYDTPASSNMPVAKTTSTRSRGRGEAQEPMGFPFVRKCAKIN